MSFLGEYEVRVDAKGRLKFPSGLKRQLSPADNGRFVLCRGIEQHLTLIPFSEWEVIAKEVNRLNPYVKKNRDFIRYFFRGAIEIILDGNDRLLLPKKLKDYAAISKEVVLFSHANKIEIWAKELHDQLMDDEPIDFAKLAEEVMGRATDTNGEENGVS